MQAITVKRVFMIIIALFSISVLAGCSGLVKRPAERSGYLYYPTALVQADQALAEARMAGKDRQCPAEYNALKDQVDQAYEAYMVCRTQEAIDMANDAIPKIKALCPARPSAVVRPEPKPEPRVVEKLIVLEDVHFDLDKSTLTKDAQAILRRNIQVMKQNPNMKVIIQGHTSAIATVEYNQKLSERRAASVKAFLMKEGGISQDRLATIGYGETQLERPEPNERDVESPAAKINRSVIFKITVR